MINTNDELEMLVRGSYSRLVSFLAIRCRDVSTAEDALSDAFKAALQTWPRDGVPRKPEAWLMAVARHRLIDEARHDQVRVKGALTLKHAARQAEAASLSDAFPDERLKLLFTCAHPSIDTDMHTPLMLQVVLRIDAARIASAFLVSPSAMRQRLVRAKAKIRNADIPFEVPDESQLPQRVDAVLQAIYAAYSSGWGHEVIGSDQQLYGLAGEAIWLARVLIHLMPLDPEVHGLLSLMLYCDSRRRARRTLNGDYVPLSDQDVQLWSISMIQEAESHLSTAGKQMQPGRFQLEAAIQSVHAQRAKTGRTDWQAIGLLYEGLVRMAPTLGALVGRAAAVAEAKGADIGLQLLDQIEASTVKTYQPYWAVRSHILKKLKRRQEAQAAFDRAIGLAEDKAVRKYLISRRVSIIK